MPPVLQHCRPHQSCLPFISRSLDTAQHGAHLPWDLPGPVQCSQSTVPPNPIQAQDTDIRNFSKILRPYFLNQFCKVKQLNRMWIKSTQDVISHLPQHKFNLGYLSFSAYYYKRFHGSQDMCTRLPSTHTWAQVWKVWQDPHHCLVFSNYETVEGESSPVSVLKRGESIFSSIPTFPCMSSLHSSSV